MKLKFRAEKKDFIIFGIFALVLLYFVAIAILNVVSFLSEYTLWGLNPLPAFGPDYLMATIVFWLFALAGVFLSVKSYFFDREKGVGIVTQKKEKSGYSRWATDKEIKKELTEIDPSKEKLDHAGIPLYNNGKHLWVDSGEYHNLVIGSTGSGKTQMIVQPMVSVLAKAGESMIITDPKGEIYKDNGELLKKNGYNIVVLNFRDPLRGNSWNPFTLPYQYYKSGNQDKAIELLEDLALNILRDSNSKNADPFWENQSADYFTGLSVALFEDAPEEEINLNSINLMIADGDTKCGMGSTYAKEYFYMKDRTGTAFVKAQGTVDAPNETRGSILSVFKQKVSMFASRENLSEMLSHSDFDMRKIGREKTAIFLVIQDEKTTYHPLVTIFLKQCYETLIDVAQEYGDKLPFKTNFILDEFANMPPLKDVTTMVTAARSRKIRFTFIIQNFAQLNDVYGKEQAETIKGNCGNIVYLISSEMAALEEISKMCGEKKSKEKDKTASTPLVTVSDLQRLPQWTVILLRIRMMPFKAKLTPYFEMANKGLWGEKYQEAEFPIRERKKFSVFNIKEFVDQKRQAKMNDIFGNSSSPSGGGRPTTPPSFPFGMGEKPAFPSSMPPMPGMKNDKSGDSFNVDDILKRIDEQIAKLEEEEKQEQEKLEKKMKEEKDLSSKPVIDAKFEEPVLPKHKEDDLDLSKDELKDTKEDFDPMMEAMVSSMDDKTKESLLEQIDQKIKELEAEEKKEVKKPTNKVEVKKESKLKEAEVSPIKTPVVENVVSLDEDFVTDDQFFDDFFNDDDI